MDFQKLSPLELRDLINRYTSDLRKLQYQVVKTQAMVSELENHLMEAESALGLQISVATVKAPEVEALPSPEKMPEKEATQKTRRRGRPLGSKNKKTSKKTKEKAAKQPTAESKGKPGRSSGSKNKATKNKEKTGKATAGKATAGKATAGKATAGKATAGKATAGKATAGKAATGKAEKKAAAKDDTPGYRLSEWDNFILDSLKDKKKVLTTSALTKIGVADASVKLGAAQIKTKLNASLHKLANKKGLLAKVEHSGRGFAYALQEWVSESGELPKKYVD